MQLLRPKIMVISGSDPSWMKIQVTLAGEAPTSAQVLSEHEGNVKWVMEIREDEYVL